MSALKSKASQNDKITTLAKPQKRDRSASEERLINAGKVIFSKYGFDGATTKMISKAADVNESLIGRYFDGKEGLLVAIIQKFLEEIGEQELSYPQQETLTDELEMYATERLKRGVIHSDFAKIIFSQALVNKEFRRRVRETVPMQLDKGLVERIQYLESHGKLKKGTDVDDLCHFVDTYLNGVFFFEYILHETKIDPIQEQVAKFMKSFATLFEN